MECFNEVSKLIVQNVSEILDSQVLVINSQGKVVISSDNSYKNLSSDQVFSKIKNSYLSLPITLDKQQGEVIILQEIYGDIPSPKLVHNLIELIIRQARNAINLSHKYEIKNKFIHKLLRENSFNESEVIREGQILGMDLTRPRAVILIDAVDYILPPLSIDKYKTSDINILKRSQFIINNIVSFFHLHDETICAYIGEGEIVVLKACSTQDLTLWASQQDSSNSGSSSWANLDALKQAGKSLLSYLQSNAQTSSIRIGIGRYHPEVKGLMLSYQDAHAALSLGKRFNKKGSRVYCLDELGFAAFAGLSDESTKVDLAKYLLGPLSHDDELLETVELFFEENCCLSSTAHKLTIHRNTLSYRLEKINILTGLDPRKFDHAIQIRLALFLKSLQSK